MSTKILSTLIFSTLLFASMYSEAKGRTKDVKNPALRTKDAYQGLVNQLDLNAAKVTESARLGEPVKPPSPMFHVRDLYQDALDPALDPGRNGDLLRTSENVRARTSENGRVVKQGFDIGSLASANQSRGLLSGFTNKLKSETVARLSDVVNGVTLKGRKVIDKRLKDNLLGFQQKVVEGKAQLTALEVKAIAYLIARVSGKKDVRNPDNQDPAAVENVRDMLHNLVEALSWTEGRPNYFGVLVHTSRNLRVGKTFKESFDVALTEVMNIREERAQIAKRWEIKRNCRYAN